MSGIGLATLLVGVFGLGGVFGYVLAYRDFRAEGRLAVAVHWPNDPRAENGQA